MKYGKIVYSWWLSGISVVLVYLVMSPGFMAMCAFFFIYPLIGCVLFIFLEVSVCLCGGQMSSFRYMWMYFSLLGSGRLCMFLLICVFGPLCIWIK